MTPLQDGNNNQDDKIALGSNNQLLSEIISRHSGESSNDNTSVAEIEESDITSTRSGSRISDEDEELAIREKLTKLESAAVLRLRILVILALFATAVAISFVVFVITKKGENDKYKSDYEGICKLLIESFEVIVKKMGSISNLGVALTAHSVDHHSAWPFVTLSNFQERARSAMYLSGALFVSVNPIVTEDNLPKWQNYVAGANSHWIYDGYAFQEKSGVTMYENASGIQQRFVSNKTIDPIHYFNEWGESVLENGTGPYLPVWQTSPVLKTKIVNENILRRPNTTADAIRCIETESAILGGFTVAPPGRISSPHRNTAFFASLQSIDEQQEVSYLGDPMSYLYVPVFDVFDETKRTVVAVMTSIIHWKSYFKNILPGNTNGIILVLGQSCFSHATGKEGNVTYHVDAGEAQIIGLGDSHDKRYDSMEKQVNITLDVLHDGTASGINFDPDTCHYHLHIYPSQEFYNSYHTNMPLLVSISVAVVFMFSIFMFIFYDRLVERRQKIVLAKATQSTVLVSSLFPETVRDRLMPSDTGDKTNNYVSGPKGRLKTFLNGNMDEKEDSHQAIADLFPKCTILFADIAGFTAWSSSRDPAQVFMLLQRIYQSFDILAKRRKVFKVETIGDCYVAAAGVPEPQENHAIIMARFAWDCVIKLCDVVRGLEVVLGPDTGVLTMRFGLHSGPVTAGVLRGDRARFQLFGDTVNTAARMESTGAPGKIQATQSTANLIADAGKIHWLKPREDKVHAKGLGLLTTFWVCPSVRKGRTSSGTGSSSTQAFAQPEKVVAEMLSQKPTKNRFVDWAVEILADHIKKIVYVRNQCGIKESKVPFVYSPPEGSTCLDEVRTAVQMPKFNAKVAACMENTSGSAAVKLSEIVLTQLHEYVTIISSLYKDNPFHNFEHACHVTMSVHKLMKRIVAPDVSVQDLPDMKLKKKDRQTVLATHLHDYTHGINSDPLILFAMLFSALIHDVDHRGVSNTQLSIEAPDLSIMYKNQSIAEQNSLDMAWDVLMMEQFDNLRCCLFASEAELKRFRQLIVNAVLATDIFDKELNDLRRRRWEQAFHPTEENNMTHFNDSDLRATIVIEHIIQASDVSHTMQHWHVYQKWNEKLFQEMTFAYRSGRMGKDPSTFWYKGELGFFDGYIIPLAKKLKECNVFGVSSDEYLNYAEHNRAEWEERGQEMVKNMVENLAGSDQAKHNT